MNKFKQFMKKKSGKAWAITSVAVVALLTTTTILATGSFRSILDTVLGSVRPKYDESITRVYESDYGSKDEVLKAGNALNKEIEGEGSVLLLNEKVNGKTALPLAKGSKVSVFGKNSTDLVLTGSGSGSAGSDGAVSLYDSLKSANIDYNPTLKEFYESSASGSGRSQNPALSEGSSKAPTLDIGETPVANYTAAVKNSFNDYSDAAIVVISRIGGESFDLPRSQNTSNGGIEGNHYLQLDQNEYDMLDMVTSKFDKVIVVLNTLTSFQLDFLEQYNNLSTNKRIDAVLWVGGPGINGAEAIGEVLNGTINPSGKTTDIYSKDFTKDPTYKNFGDNSQNFNGESAAAFTENGQNVSDNFMVTYEEGIYVGYKYYETRGYEEKQNGNDEWYDNNVVYPFGYGLSYTSFTQSMEVSGSVATGVDVSVTVKNTGSVAGKDVVELYVTLPYISGEIEKSHVQLVDFAKTGTLQPDGSETISFHINPYDLASYDYNDANNNSFKGYELDAGEYTFYISSDSHVDSNAFAHQSLRLDTGMKFENDTTTNNKVENLYTTDDFDDLQYRLSDVSVKTANGVVTRKGMSRTDFEGTFPTAPDVDERAYLDGEQEALSNRKTNNDNLSSYTTMPTTGAKNDIELRDLYGLSYDDPKWEKLLDELTYEDMINLVNKGAFQTEAILSIGKNLTNDSDGPVGFVNFMPGLSSHYKNNPTFACEIVIAATWNKDLAYQMGKIVGETGLWGDVGGNDLPYSGWYAPACNIHRSPFSGRNYEYYSEDAILSGKMAVNVINGAKSKGVYTDLKHFALNDQETNRSGVATYCTEQAFREIYLKPFEMGVKGSDDPKYSATAVKDKVTKYTGTTGVMSSFNRAGVRWTGGDYRLMTKILRNEWGFKGLVICDYKTDNSVMDSRQMVYAGNDLILASLNAYMWNDSSSSNAEDMNILRNASHNILYTIANSNSVNAKVIGYGLEVWVVLLIVADCVAFAALVAWGVLGTLLGKPKKKEDEE